MARMPSLPPASDPSEEVAVAGAEEGFALRLLNRVTTPGKNVTVSPLSLAVALAMLENGAAGQTSTQIKAVQGTSDLTPAQQDRAWSSLIRVLSAESRAHGISLDLADSLWLQRNLPLQAGFMTSLAEYFQTGVWQVDFENNRANAGQAINTWVSEHTAGRITQLFQPGQLTADTALVLANSLYFRRPGSLPSIRPSPRPAPFTVRPASRCRSDSCTDRSPTS